MPLFVIIGYDTANSQTARQNARPSHLARLTALQQAGKIVIAGPTPICHGSTQMSGSVIIADFDTVEAAQLWANDDPYLIDGVYSHIELRPFIQVLP